MQKLLFILFLFFDSLQFVIAQPNEPMKEVILNFTKLSFNQKSHIDSITALCSFPFFDFGKKNKIYRRPSEMKTVISDARINYFHNLDEFRIDSLFQSSVCPKVKFPLPSNIICYI